MTQPEYPMPTANEIVSQRSAYDELRQKDRELGAKDQRAPFALFAAGAGAMIAAVPLGLAVGPGLIASSLLAGGIGAMMLSGAVSASGGTDTVAESDPKTGDVSLKQGGWGGFSGLKIGAAQMAHHLDARAGQRTDVMGVVYTLGSMIMASMSNGRALDATAPEAGGEVYDADKYRRVREAKRLLASEGFEVGPRQSKINMDFVNQANTASTAPDVDYAKPKPPGMG